MLLLFGSVSIVDRLRSLPSSSRRDAIMVCLRLRLVCAWEYTYVISSAAAAPVAAAAASDEVDWFGMVAMDTI